MRQRARTTIGVSSARIRSHISDIIPIDPNRNLRPSPHLGAPCRNPITNHWNVLPFAPWSKYPFPPCISASPRSVREPLSALQLQGYDQARHCFSVPSITGLPEAIGRPIRPPVTSRLFECYPIENLQSLHITSPTRSLFHNCNRPERWLGWVF